MAAAKEMAAIELPRLDIGLMEVTLVGDSPRIVLPPLAGDRRSASN